MPVQAKADNNVPWIGPRARYPALPSTPTWIYHRMASAALGGETPVETGFTEATTDPTVSAGLIEFKNLTKGGLFTTLYHAKRPFIIEASDLSSGVALTIVRPGNLTTPSRAFPSSYPVKIAAGEIVRASGNPMNGYAGILVRPYEEKLL